MRDLRLYDVLLAIRWDIEGFLEELLDLFDLGESPSIGHDCLLSIVSESNEHHPREEQKFKVQFSRPKKPLRKIRKFEFSLDNFFGLARICLISAGCGSLLSVPSKESCQSSGSLIFPILFLLLCGS